MSNVQRRYGFFKCPDCNQKWESSHAYCHTISGQPAYKQECKNCKTSCLPYRTERLTCSHCGLQDCICTREEKQERHTDLNKPHRSDLCEKCKKGYPCANRF